MEFQKDKPIKLSVVIVSYRHERYIRQCLESVIMQQVDFPMEVLVADDASPDNTQKIIREVACERPGFFQLFLRTSNLGATKNLADLYSRTKGEYIILLEGDDYWTDKSKLQKEVDFLDQHPDFIAVAHPCEVVDADSNIISNRFPYPNSKKRIFSYKEYFKGMLPGQTATLMHRNYYYHPVIIKGQYIDNSPSAPGDRKKTLLLMANGKIGILQEKMSCYRYVPYSGYSWTAQLLRDKDYLKNYQSASVNALTDYLNYVSSIHIHQSGIRYIYYLRFFIMYDLHSLDKSYPFPNINEIPCKYWLGFLGVAAYKLVHHFGRKLAK